MFVNFIVLHILCYTAAGIFCNAIQYKIHVAQMIKCIKLRESLAKSDIKKVGSLPWMKLLQKYFSPSGVAEVMIRGVLKSPYYTKSVVLYGAVFRELSCMLLTL